MKKNDYKDILKQAKVFFKQTIAVNHLKNCEKASKLSDYNVNPFLIKYLANFLRGDEKPRSIAEALVYPRILGTSITTSFGNNVQKFISQVLKGFGSAVGGIDIEFIDHEDGRKKYAQLKLGPNCINKDDISTIIGHFKKVRNLARTNNLNIGIDDLAIGVLYGRREELNSFYKKLNFDYPVFVGETFWYRLTGHRKFYFDLINIFGEVAVEVDGTKALKETIDALEKEIKISPSF
ncbi:MAG: PmeII family type II restriction endonuclease [Candidatus Margulisiibacteriota bacterium]|nr:PmeII family type II restriction endonuclease [Candidatus Margulisiibacteriota bacterium]